MECVVQRGGGVVGNVHLVGACLSSLACQTFVGGRERLVTIACNPWPLPECWQSQSDLSCG